MGRPLISIITPTYNHEKYIAECIESVLNQTYENWEMIIIDDCSNDKTYEIAKKYAEKDKRIKLIRHSENYGALNLDKTYNEALSIANGEWIAILEGDDVWIKSKLEYQVELLRNLSSDVILLHAHVGLIYEDIGKIVIPNKKFIFIENIPSIIPYDASKYLFYGFNPIYSQSVLIKKESLLKIGGFIQIPRDIRLVDFPTWLRLSKLGKFVYDKKVIGFWRRHEKSITMNYSDVIAIKYAKSIKEYFREQGIEPSNNNCIGFLSYLSAIRPTILKKDFKMARYFLNEVENCIKLAGLHVNFSMKLKLFTYKLMIKFRQPNILNVLYNFKRNFVDEYLYNYKPFFFRDELFIKRLEDLNSFFNKGEYK